MLPLFGGAEIRRAGVPTREAHVSNWKAQDFLSMQGRRKPIHQGNAKRTVLPAVGDAPQLKLSIMASCVRVSSRTVNSWAVLGNRRPVARLQLLLGPLALLGPLPLVGPLPLLGRHEGEGVPL